MERASVTIEPTQTDADDDDAPPMSDEVLNGPGELPEIFGPPVEGDGYIIDTVLPGVVVE
jgi:hypothetical protein